MKKAFKIVFMGTPRFSVPALEALHTNGYEVALVVTPPDRPMGRGRKIAPCAVKSAALDLGYRLMQVKSIKTPEFLDTIAELEPDFLVVISFGYILPVNLLSLPRIGTINVHASLLPKYRGAAPIQWAVIEGEKETGVCTMVMEKELDTGDILLCAEEPIHPDDTAGALHDRLAVKSARLLIDTLEAYEDNRIKAVPQDHSLATYAPMLSKEDGRIDWNKSAEFLQNFTRGVNPWPGAFTFIGEKRLKILKSRAIQAEFAAPPGTVLKGFTDELRIATGDGVLGVEEIQGASGKPLPIKSYLQGNPIPPGTVLS